MAVRKLTGAEYQAWLEKKRPVALRSLVQQGVHSQAVTLGKDIATQETVTLSFEQRTRGTYVIGKTGAGKTTGLVNMALDDMHAGRGVCYLDPHGDAITDILARMPSHRLGDVILLDPLDEDYVPGLHFFSCENPQDITQIDRVLDSTLEVFAKIFTEEGNFSKAPQMELVLANLALLLIDNPGLTMNEIPLLLDTSGKRIRKSAMERIAPERLQALWFWQRYNDMTPKEQRELSQSTYTRFYRFLSYQHIAQMVGQRRTTLPFDTLLDSNAILLVKLPPEHPNLSRLMGSVFIELFANAVFARSRQDKALRQPFCLFVDEFQEFATPTFGKLLAGVRKFNLAITIAHQWRDQLSEALKGATLNAGNLMMYQVSGKDAEELVKQLQFTPVSTETRRGAKLAISENPVEYLTKNGHNNPKVSGYIWFVRKLKKMLERVKEKTTWYTPSAHGELFTDEGKLDYTRDDLLKGIELLNDYLVDMMHKRATPGSFAQVSSITQICVQLRGYLGFASQGEALFDTYYNTGFIGYEEHPLPASYQEPIAKFAYAFIDAGQALLPSGEENKGASLLEAIIEHDRELLDKNKTGDIPEEDIDQAISERSEQEYRSFENAFFTLLELGRYLYDDPIQVTGGQWEEIPIPRQYADMEREVAMSLANPAQPFSARVKVGTAEYVLQTHPMPAAASDQVVRERIDLIREQNFLAGYTRQRKKVAREIRKRQAKLLEMNAQEEAAKPAEKRDTRQRRDTQEPPQKQLVVPQQAKAPQPKTALPSNKPLRVETYDREPVEQQQPPLQQRRSRRG